MVTRSERARRALLDWGCTLLGFAIIVHQAFIINPTAAKEWIMGTGLVLLTGPAGIAVVSRLRNGGADTTSGLSSTPALPPPSGQPLSSTPAPGAAEA